MSAQTAPQQPTQHLRMPMGYDLSVAQTYSFLVNVAVDMCKQWISQGSPLQKQGFQWTQAGNCEYTSRFSPSSFTFSDPIWSTFSVLGKHYQEPFGFVATSGTTAYLAFRGSQTTADDEMDAEISQVPYTSPLQNPPSGMEVEKGFYGVYNGLLAPLTSALQAAQKHGCTSLLLTGHSLGSTLATLAVPLALSLGFKGTQYNQASPRVGNATFATYVGELQIPTFRLVNIYDMVPKTPLGKQYQAVGLEAWYGADYPSEAEKHSPCCSYSYALSHTNDPYNPNITTCMTT